MKQQLSIFLIFLILVNYSISVNIKNNILLNTNLDKAMKMKSKETVSNHNFIDTKMLETCDEGILADVDFTNVFYYRQAFINKIFNLSNNNNNSIFQNVPIFNTQIKIGENGKSMARLSIKFVSPGVRLTYVGNGTYQYNCRLMFDTLEINSFWSRQDYAFSETFEDVILSGTLFNIPPGLYILSLQCWSFNGSLIFGNQVNHSFMEFSGEYSAGSTASTVPDKFLLPADPKFISRKKTKIIFAVDDIIRYVNVNNSNLRFDYYATPGEIDTCCNSKAYPIMLAEGDTVAFQGWDRGNALRGMRVNVNYYNNLGYPEIFNSNYQNYKVFDYNPSSQGENMSKTQTPIENTNNYLPIDYSASWIWNSGGNGSYAYAEGVLPRTNTNSVLFVQACSELVEIKLNSKKIEYTGYDNKKCERVLQIKSPNPMDILKSGDKLSITVRNSATAIKNANKNKAYDSVPFNNSFLAAVIAYKNSLGDVVELRTGNSLWTCNGKKPSKVPIQSNFRNDFYLTAAFQARAIFDNSVNPFICEITLP